MSCHVAYVTSWKDTPLEGSVEPQTGHVHCLRCMWIWGVLITYPSFQTSATQVSLAAILSMCGRSCRTTSRSLKTNVSKFCTPQYHTISPNDIQNKNGMQILPLPKGKKHAFALWAPPYYARWTASQVHVKCQIQLWPFTSYKYL